MDMGVFIPIGNNGWIISNTSPQYKPTFDLNKEIFQRAEHYGMDFVLSMIKLRGFGGKTEFWDYNLESFTLMAGLAAVTSKIRLFASTAILTLPPAIVARMATTIDLISGGRFGVNIVSGWHKAEYDQMGLWPGDEYFGYRYEYAAEYVHILKELWAKGASNFKGKHFTMNDCRMQPTPAGTVKIVAAGQSPTGMDFAAKYTDYNFLLATGVNTPIRPCRSQSAAHRSHREDRPRCWRLCAVHGHRRRDRSGGIRQVAKIQSRRGRRRPGWPIRAVRTKPRTASSTAATINLPEQAVNFNMGTLVGSYATVARLLDEAARVPGTKGLMLTFDDFVVGIEQFGRFIQPLMQTRADRFMAAA